MKMIEVYDQKCLFKDTYTIIEMMDDTLRSKINPDFINFLKENQDNSFEGTINKNIPLKYQNIREEIKIMLSLMYIDYFCETNKKEQIIQKEENNIKQFYNRDLFENNNSKEQNIANESKEIVVYKETLIQKIIKKIKYFFSKK